MVLEAGLTLDHSFKMLLDLADDPKLVKLLSALQAQVRGGDTFPDADAFESLYIDVLAGLPHVQTLTSQIAMKTVKRSRRLPIS